MENQNAGSALEERLRTMILHHADRDVNAPTQPNVNANAAYNGHYGNRRPSDIAPGPGLLTTGLDPGRAGQEDFLVDNQASSAFSKGGRKRPNQAQRRQMSAQLSIPVDTRPQMPQSARGYVSLPAFPHQQYSSYGNQGRAQRPHSATFRPPSRGNAMPNAPGAGGPFAHHPRHHPSSSYHGPMTSPGEWQQSHPPNGDPRTSFRGAPAPYDPASPRASRHTASGSYGSNKLYHVRPEELVFQAELLERLCKTIIAEAEIEVDDIREKEDFRAMIEMVARTAIAQHEQGTNGVQDFPPESVQLRCFGSLSSGFATKAADMDLGLLSPFSLIPPDAPGSPIPRIVEKAFLDIGLGARLLTRTRVPIIKVCQRPPEKLRTDLVNERVKWEKGLPDDAEDDDTNEEPDLTVANAIEPHDYRQHYRKASQQSAEDAKPALKPDRRFRSLRQGDKKSIASYYSLAKGLLRKLGGRDLTHSNASDLKADDLQFMNEFGLAFVDGLADDELRTRLLSYKSLSRYDLTSKPNNYRTFHGVYTQVEGELMVLKWESREIDEKDAVNEQQGLSCIKNWRALGNKQHFGLDPIGYAKELQIASDQLKKIPSIQIMLLSQNQHESAPMYHTRAMKTMLELGVHDRPGANNTKLHIAVQHYAEGIAIEQVRREVEELVCATPKDTLTLRSVARRHKSLQLAHEFERCLDKGLYSGDDAATVKQYISVLRAPMVEPSSSDAYSGRVIAPPPESAQIMSRIRELGDPATMSPNQPRDPYRDRLEFPKSGVGVQCDINFSAHLALQNTQLLRCYSHTDPRVRPLVLFVKHWAKVRRINSPYRGTLSSYGYVLMMLHYLVNVAEPFVCPNLQELGQSHPPDPNLTPEQVEQTITCKGRDIRFWRDEAGIQRLARENALNQNGDTIGQLLRGFFEYYAQSNQMSTVNCRGFDWGRDVLSLRTHRGLLSKQEKGWTGAKTVIEIKQAVAPPPPVGPDQGDSPRSAGGPPGLPGIGAQSPRASQAPREVKEVRHRYLFAIEDPFEHDHNVARTVTHNGIVAIRDEFRRAWRIIKDAGRGIHQEDLLQDVSQADDQREKEQFSQLLDELHGAGGLL